MSRASTTSPLVIVAAILQPTATRRNRCITAAWDSHASGVGTSVTSETEEPDEPEQEECNQVVAVQRFNSSASSLGFRVGRPTEG